jgi:hypothetical protein
MILMDQGSVALLRNNLLSVWCSHELDDDGHRLCLAKIPSGRKMDLILKSGTVLKGIFD